MQQHQTTECMDAVNDVHEKIKWKREREENHEKQAQQQAQVQAQQQPQYEIRDPHGILYLIRSRL